MTQANNLPNIIVRDPSYKAQKEGAKELVVPLNPKEATDWGARRILALPSSLAGWAGFLIRGSSVWGISIKLLEVAVLEIQVASGISVLAIAAAFFLLWRKDPSLRGNILGKIAPFFFLTLLVFGGEYLGMKNKSTVNEVEPRQIKVVDSEGVG